MIWMWQPTPNLACTDVLICNNCSTSLILSTPKSWQLYICLQKLFSHVQLAHVWYLAHIILKTFHSVCKCQICACVPFPQKSVVSQFLEGFFFLLLVSWICLVKSMCEMEKEGRRRFSFAEFISSLFQTLAMQVCTERSKNPELSS